MNPNREVSRVIGARLAVGMAMRTKIPWMRAIVCSGLAVMAIMALAIMAVMPS